MFYVSIEGTQIMAWQVEAWLRCANQGVFVGRKTTQKLQPDMHDDLYMLNQGLYATCNVGMDECKHCLWEATFPKLPYFASRYSYMPLHNDIS